MWKVLWWLMGDQQPNKVSCYVMWFLRAGGLLWPW